MADTRNPATRCVAAGLLLLLTQVGGSPLRAQSPDGGTGAFVSGGVGPGSHFTAHGSLSLAHSTGDYLLRVASARGVDLTGGSPWSGPTELTEVSLLYGRRKAWGRGWARAALGVGYVDGPQPAPVAPGEEPTTSGAGLAAQLGIAWTPLPALGIGLTGLGNLNEVRSVAAATLTVHVGRVR